MSSKENARHRRAPGRRKRVPKAESGQPRSVDLRFGLPQRELLELVRTGVEEFILNKASIEDFFTAIRAVGDDEKVYTHQLTMSVFSRIVKEAIRKRDLGQST